ncbi:MAG: phenylalanine--tRNA ligase subunit beta [Pirellulaceae bacterium]|nr:phenylalanine--tRNA ligase subunit beta [Pirellulaceae bacterium]
MLVCWEWLEQYVRLDVKPDDLADRFAMSGLNHESTTQVGGDVVIDLEVTSNRCDCLGHIGVAREASVLLGQGLCLPPAIVKEDPALKASDLIQVENRFAEACPRYTARVLQGVKIGPSPEWLVRRLSAIGINSVNNVVDVTNYVMMECGQPLHAFDLDQIQGRKIIVRPAAKDEKFLAIDHHTYELDEQTVVIADAQRAVALGGVMGGAESEVSDSTTNLLIEAASFEPLAIRRTARRLKLHSPSSFRFERRPDPAGLDWASRRCCELILQVAGGKLASGVVDTGANHPQLEPIVFRLNQLLRVLGITIPTSEVVRILSSLGCEVSALDADTLRVIAPSWRRDVTREIDLIEEVARIYGYDQIPEDAVVPLTVAPTRPKDIVLGRVRQVLSAYGVDEAITPSVVPAHQDACGSPWSEREALSTDTPLLEGARLLRRSLLPSLLAARSWNQTQAGRDASLYEVANVYLPGDDQAALPMERSMLALVTGQDLLVAKGLVEDIAASCMSRETAVVSAAYDHPLFQRGTATRYDLNGQLLGFVGLISKSTSKAVGVTASTAVAELSVETLIGALEEIRRSQRVSPYPSITRDLNFVLDESLRWAQLESMCRTSGGALLQQVEYRETYRDEKKDGAGKKRVLLSLVFQSPDRTLTSAEVDAAVGQIIADCQTQCGGQLLG